nr:uncharacterized protein LOC111987173 [Quercus suber]
MVVKSKQEALHTGDLQAVFEVLRRHKLRLNAEKCTFGVGAGKFLGYLINRCRPFYQLLKKWIGFRSSEECDVAFVDLKNYLARAPMLTAPEPGEDLFMYLAVSEHAVSAVLLRDKGIQQLVYYISKTLVDAETRYLPLEKLVLALIHTTRKLPHYFQAHTIYILTEYPLQSLLKRSDFTGRVAKWGTRLGSFDIWYRPRSSVKGQVLADFVAEFSPKEKGEMVCRLEARLWKVFVDGASSSTGASSGVVIITPEGIRLEHSFRLGFRASNNEVEYEAFLAGLRTASSLGAREVELYSDSRLVVNQVLGSFEARDPRMKAYLEQAKLVMAGFNTVKVFQVARTQNRHADSLATLASSVIEEILWQIKVELIPEPSVRVMSDSGTTGINVTAIAALTPCWINPIIDFLVDDRLPSDEKEGIRIRRAAPRYWLAEDRTLYQRSFGGPYLLCLRPEKVGELLAELHSRPAGHLNPISSSWPFARWGLDIIGPFPRATGGRKFVLVAVDYFTKWAEADALANIQDVEVKKFLWKNIITRFGVPNTIISDNGLQFDSRAFREFCGGLGIKNRYSTPAYPQGNSQAEAVNKVIVSGLKKRLEGAKGNWAEELPKVLWAYRTTPRRSTGDTPFSLTYGAEAVIPTEVNLCSA